MDREKGDYNGQSNERRRHNNSLLVAENKKQPLP